LKGIINSLKMNVTRVTLTQNRKRKYPFIRK